MIFAGNPGNGKTMAARWQVCSRTWASSKKDIVVEVQRSDLVAEHIGGTAQKTEKTIKRDDGGVLFLDEAYRLCSPSDKDFGREALETIMDRMYPSPNKNVNNPIFIFAGYELEMEEFLMINPGLPRRIKTKLTFQNFSNSELVEITKRKIMERSFRFPLGIAELLIDCFTKIPKEVIASPNGRLCNDLVVEIQVQQEKRLPFDCSSMDLQKFTMEDMQLGIEEFLEARAKVPTSVDVGVMCVPQTCDRATMTDVLNVTNVLFHVCFCGYIATIFNNEV